MPFNSTAPKRRVKYIPKALRWLLIIVSILIVLGFFNIYSATYYMDLHSGDSAYYHILNHSIYLILGIIGSVIVSRCNDVFIRKHSLLWVGITLLLLLAVVVAGRTVNGATRWIQIGPVSLQPSEIAKVSGIIWTASYLAPKLDKKEKITIFYRFFKPFIHSRSKRKSDSFSAMIGYFKPLIAPFIMAVMVLMQPDMGTAGMIIFFPGFLYILSGMPIKEIVWGITAAIGGFFLLALIEPYRWDRVIVLWDPFSHARDLGYQTVQSLIAVGSGGIFGQGLGQGLSKFLYLPEQYTDFAYAVFSQEFGFIGSVCILILYVAFLCCGFSVARQLKYTYHALLVYGLTMLISIQGIINIAMVIGCFPVTGIPLPFISYGGTSLLINMLAVALIYNTVTKSLYRSDMEERRTYIAAMEGKLVSLDKFSGTVFHPENK